MSDDWDESIEEAWEAWELEVLKDDRLSDEDRQSLLDLDFDEDE